MPTQKKFKTPPNVPSSLNSDGRQAFLRLARHKIDKDGMTPYSTGRIHQASFIEQQMKAIEKQMNDTTDADKMELYIKLSTELREIKKELFKD